MILSKNKEVRDQETEVARVNAEIAAATEELNRMQTLCERESNLGD